jgi:hypothetical protein
MIYILVTQEIVPGKMAEWGEIAVKELAPLRSKLGVKQAGSFHAYTGNMNKNYTLNAYIGLAEFQKVTEAQRKDKDWQRVMAKMNALVVSQEYTVIEPNPWSPMK